MLTQDTIQYVLDFCAQNPDFVKFHKYTHCPDEFFFQTILMNSPIKERIVHNNYWYLDWFNHTNNPKTLKLGDFDKIIHSNKFFARKFDHQVCSAVMDKIDQYREAGKTA